MKRTIATYLPKVLTLLFCAVLYFVNAHPAEESAGRCVVVNSHEEMAYDESNSAGRELGLSGKDMALGVPSARIASAERTIVCGRTSFQTSSQGRPTSSPRRIATQFCKSGKFIDINQTNRVVVLLWLWLSDLFSPQSMLINLRRLRL